MLARGGVFYMVANRHLPYEAALTAAFGEITELAGPPGFKLIAARRPRPAR
jgi:16S rRNA (guanine1207-N2)-methyltransferase